MLVVCECVRSCHQVFKLSWVLLNCFLPSPCDLLIFACGPSIQNGRELCQARDGSRWRQAQWKGQEVTVREHNLDSKWSTTELMVMEMESLSMLRHPNILLLMATCCGPTKHDLLLVAEPVQTPSLFQLLHQFGERLLSQRIGIALGLSKGKPLMVL